MWFWWFMFVSNLLIPALLIAVGYSMWKHCPGKINAVIGYRTRRSMKNMDTWKFAHEYCGRLWWKIGWGMLLPSVLVQIPAIHSSENIVGTVGGIVCMVQTVALVVSIIPTERALKRTFTEDGKRR